MHELTPLLLLIINITFLYFISKLMVNELFTVLKILLRSTHVVYAIIAFIFFPGTLLHELAHFLVAQILLLKVTEFNLIPSWHHNSIRLGHVAYIKRDVIRSILVGVAPVFGGVVFFWWFASLHIFPHQNIWITCALAYIILVISSMMFSSKQDLVDMIYIVPIGLIVALIIYFLPITLKDIIALTSTPTFASVNRQINIINFMFLVSNTIQIIAWILLRIMRRLMRH